MSPAAVEHRHQFAAISPLRYADVHDLSTRPNSSSNHGRSKRGFLDFRLHSEQLRQRLTELAGTMGAGLPKKDTCGAGQESSNGKGLLASFKTVSKVS